MSTQLEKCYKSILHLGSNKILKRLTTYTLVAATLSTGNTFGQDQPVHNDVEFAPQQQELQWSPGEQYNAVNGTMNYSHTDLYLPGNGKLPIEITRRFLQRSHRSSSSDPTDPTGLFGHFSLDVPYLYHGVDQNPSNAWYCKHDGGFNSRSRIRRPVTFKYGDTTKVFYRSSRSPDTLLITQDGWEAECLPYKRSIGYENKLRVAGTMLVTRPDGVQFELWVGNFGLGSGGQFWLTSFKIHQISDPYGNTLTYNYDENKDPEYESFDVSRLESITANDGRVITFKYQSDEVEPYLSTIYGRGSNYGYKVISTVESKGKSSPFSIKYDYSNSYTQVRVTTNNTHTTTVSTSDGKIDSIAYPTGGVVHYEYSNEIFRTASTPYKVLNTRRTSDGATYDFKFTDNGDGTFIRGVKTPSAWLEYTYGEPVAPSSSGVIIGHNINSGRLIGFSRYGLNSDNSKGEKLISVDYEYVDLSNPPVGNQVLQLVKERKITTSMNFTNSIKAASVFVKDFEYSDPNGWGLPSRVIETRPLGSAIASNYRYYSPSLLSVKGRVASSSAQGDSQSFVYNAQGDVVRHTDNGIATTYAWHQSGELNTQTTALGNTTSFFNHKRGQATTIIDPSGYTQYRSINDNGTLSSETRFSSNPNFFATDKTRYRYDTLRRLIAVEPERSEASTTRHHWVSNTSRTTYDESQTRHYSRERYDAFGRIRVESRLDRDQNRWGTVIHQYDSEGRLRSTSYPVELSYPTGSIPSDLPGTHYLYDALDRIIQVRHNEEHGNDTVFDYVYGADSNGRLTIKETDARGSVKTTTYDSYGSPHYQWPVLIKDPDGQVSIISRYGINGSVTRYSRGLQYFSNDYDVTTYKYNSRAQLTELTQLENGKTSFTYDSDGRLETRSNNGRGVKYVYYRNGLIHKEIYTDSVKEDVTREYTYDAYRNLESATTTSPSGSQDNSLSYRYDADNNVTSLLLIVDSRKYQLSFDYDELSNLTHIRYPNGRRYSLSPNSLGSPTQIQETGGAGKRIYDQVRYNPNNSMRLMLRNSHQITNELNRALRPDRYKASENFGRFNGLGERRYKYDRAANVKQIDDTVMGHYKSLRYDSKNRLIEEINTNADNWTYGYSRNDNIAWMHSGSTRSSFEYDEYKNRLRSVRTGNVERVYGYDAHGNITAHERLQGSSKVTRILTYNAANQLVSMNDGTSYAYDTRGLRVKQDRNGAIYTLYGPDERLMYRYDRQTQVTSEYFYVDGKLVARRDTDIGEGTPSVPTGTTGGSGISVSGLRISWPDDGWYQVQTEDGRNTLCSGGRSCNVPSSGSYLVINHTTKVRSTVVVR